MGSEFFINSERLQEKIRQSLPSQGGSGAGFDLSASTQIIPVIDLTETAEGSVLRQDLQTSLSFGSQTTFAVGNTTSTLINNTGFYKIFGTATFRTATGSAEQLSFQLNDGASNKIIFSMYSNFTSTIEQYILPFDFNIFLPAGHSLTATAPANSLATGSTRQIATIAGELVNPSGF